MTTSPESITAGALRPGVRVPDFFIIGQAKSGTTALYEMLRRHPQIHMPEAKEPWFFATDMRPRFQHPMAGAAPETLQEYLELFTEAGPDQIIDVTERRMLRAFLLLRPFGRDDLPFEHA